MATRRKHKVSAFMIIDILILSLFGVITLLPVLHVVAKAFSGEGPVIAGLISFWPKQFQTDTILYVLKKPEFSNSFGISVFITLLGTFIAMFLTVTAAYPLSKPELKGRKFFLYIFVFIMLFNAGMVPNYLLYRSLNLTNTIWALIFPGAFSVFNMLIVKNYFESLPATIEEAAKIDGASNMQTLFKVVLPMSLPVLATVTLFYAVAFWNNYMAGVLYITDPFLKPLQQYLYDLINEALNTLDATGNVADIDSAMNLTGESVRAATIVVSTVPILIVYPYLQKYFVKGITIGSVKG
ncbi:carbohydrate ABC transporter permease [Xylanivirga thermophila]|uniref:carbohydrate ABC transporter permease n=1 Tax=Xylanivirga thermophila TaxID=2496273 RepID=UPI00101BF79B|nr:carbohydrate ABC transporter permease [Xylanivirga thermophila]